MLVIKISNAIKFYRYIGKELRAPSSALLKTVPLKDKAESCFSECVNNFGCQSFNVYQGDLGGHLLCDLFDTTNGDIFESEFKEHFTTSIADEAITASPVISSGARSITVTAGINSFSSTIVTTTAATTLSATSHPSEEIPLIADYVLFTIETMDMCFKWQQQTGKFESKLDGEPCMLSYFKAGIVVFTPNGNTRCMFRGNDNVLDIRVITNPGCTNFVGISTASTQLKFSDGRNLCLGIDNNSEAIFMTCTSTETRFSFREADDTIINEG